MFLEETHMSAKSEPILTKAFNALYLYLRADPFDTDVDRIDSEHVCFTWKMHGPSSEKWDLDLWAKCLENQHKKVENWRKANPAMPRFKVNLVFRADTFVEDSKEKTVLLWALSTLE